MQLVVRSGGDPAAENLVIPAFQNEPIELRALERGARARSSQHAHAPSLKHARDLVATLARSGDFKGRPLEIAVVHPPRGRVRRVILLGLGPRAEVSPARLRMAAAQLARRAAELELRALAMVMPSLAGIDSARVAQSLAEGAALGACRFTRYRREPERVRARLELRVADEGASRRDLAAAAVRGTAWGAAACRARALANTPGDDLTPAGLAAEAVAIARESGARATVLDEGAMQKLGMGAVLAVGRGSVHPPRFIVLERDAGAAGAATRPRATRRPAVTPAQPDSVPTVVLIGKGVTFDTGGISLKPRDGMGRMKYDMSGAAAVLGVFAALPGIELPFRVVGLVPAAENMPAGNAFKPGDIVRMFDGTTVEVTNTDAEGRLLLGDALAYARRFAPDVVVDLATLTGAVRLALGSHAAGLFTRDDALAAELLAASDASGERLWRMPLWEEYAEALKSDVADLVNSAGPEGGASIAAGFLARFASGMRWAHLDIASTAWASADRPHEPRGPTGFGVRLLLEWLTSRTASAPGARSPASTPSSAPSSQSRISTSRSSRTRDRA